MDTDIKHRASSSLGKGTAIGAAGGVVASVVMGVYAMVASFLDDEGVFTPLHHIATLFAEPAAMTDSMMSAAAGAGSWEISLGTAILGLVIHMIVGAVYGALFGAVMVVVKLSGTGLIEVAGLVWGGLVFLISSYVGLPLAAAALGVGDLTTGPMAGMNPIADMAEMVGAGTFLPEHLVFGLVVGLIYAGASRRRV